MTRKDYVRLAAALAGARPRDADYDGADEWFGAETQWRRDRDAIALALAEDNPRFDWDRFTAATEA